MFEAFLSTWVLRALWGCLRWIYSLLQAVTSWRCLRCYHTVVRQPGVIYRFHQHSKLLKWSSTFNQSTFRPSLPNSLVYLTYFTSNFTSSNPSGICYFTSVMNWEISTFLLWFPSMLLQFLCMWVIWSAKVQRRCHFSGEGLKRGSHSSSQSGSRKNRGYSIGLGRSQSGGMSEEADEVPLLNSRLLQLAVYVVKITTGWIELLPKTRDRIQLFDE